MSKRKKNSRKVTAHNCAVFVTTTAHVLLALDCLTPAEHAKLLNCFCPCGRDHLADVPMVKKSIGASIALIKQACLADTVDGQALADELDYLQFKHVHELKNEGV